MSPNLFSAHNQLRLCVRMMMRYMPLGSVAQTQSGEHGLRATRATLAYWLLWGIPRNAGLPYECKELRRHEACDYIWGTRP